MQAHRYIPGYHGKGGDLCVAESGQLWEWRGVQYRGTVKPRAGVRNGRDGVGILALSAKDPARRQSMKPLEEFAMKNQKVWDGVREAWAESWKAEGVCMGRFVLHYGQGRFWLTV